MKNFLTRTAPTGRGLTAAHLTGTPTLAPVWTGIAAGCFGVVPATPALTSAVKDRSVAPTSMTADAVAAYVANQESRTPREAQVLT